MALSVDGIPKILRATMRVAFVLAIVMSWSLSAPAMAGLIAPKNSSENNPVTFRWDGDKSATHFLFRILRGNNVVYAAKRKTSGFGCNGGGSCSLQRSGLSDGQYDWQVQAFNGSKRKGWLPKASFTIGSDGSPSSDKPSDGGTSSSGGSQDGPGVLISPSGSNEGSKITFRWEGYKNADEFLWRVLRSNNVHTASRRKTSAYGCGNGGTCSISRSGFADGKYEWQVKAFENGKSKAWSPKASFTVGSASGGSQTDDDSSNDGGDNTTPPSSSSGKPVLGSRGLTPSQFEKMTGVPTRIELGYARRHEGWKPLEGDGWPFNNIAKDKNSSKKLWVLSYALMPSGIGSSSQNLTKCARGDFNKHYRKLGQSLKDRGIKSMVIRAGWEWNLSWPWGTRNKVSESKKFGDCFRHFVNSVDGAFPGNQLLYEWNVNQDASKAAMDAAWPGNQYVDFVGVDIYDTYFKSDSCKNQPSCRWNKRTKPVLDKIKQFASKKNKRIAMSEWGLWGKGGDGRGGGDNPYFIEQLCQWVKNPSNKVGFYIYFNTKSGINEHRLEKFPKGKAAFAKHCVGNPGNPHSIL